MVKKISNEGLMKEIRTLRDEIKEVKDWAEKPVARWYHLLLIVFFAIVTPGLVNSFVLEEAKLTFLSIIFSIIVLYCSQFIWNFKKLFKRT